MIYGVYSKAINCKSNAVCYICGRHLLKWFIAFPLQLLEALVNNLLVSTCLPLDSDVTCWLFDFIQNEHYCVYKNCVVQINNKQQEASKDWSIRICITQELCRVTDLLITSVYNAYKKLEVWTLSLVPSRHAYNIIIFFFKRHSFWG